MGKRNIYLVQVDTLRKLPTHTTVYLPYAAGALWAYAKQAPAVAEAYALGELFFLRDPIEEAAARMEDPFLVGFSCYVWSTEYNKALARAVKERCPDCHILFGGHNVPPGGAMLEELPYVDFLIQGEGEIPFQALLAELCKEEPDFAAVPGLVYRAGGNSTAVNPQAVAQSIEGFPSPYLEGVFGPAVAAHPEIQWSTVWETNRGCPYHCAYCDWGQHKAKVRPFPTERLLAEIEWMSENRVSFVYCADANFGILERDEGFLDALAAARDRTGFPRMFDVNTTKIFDERTFRITEKLNRSGLDKTGASFAVQSLSPTALHNIGRKNIDDGTLSEWIRRCRQAGYRTHTDLIIGLPGETLHSFCAGVEKLFTLGQHEGIRYFPCNILPNTLMATPAYREKHKIRTARTVFKLTMEAMPEVIPEFIEVVDATATMSHEDCMTAIYFMQLVHGAHCFGLLRLAAMYLHTENIVPYAEFYLKLLDFCHRRPDTLPGEAMGHMEENFSALARGEEAEPLQLPGFSFGGMGHDQYFVARAVLEPERFYADAAAFLLQFDVEPSLLAQLLRYQRESILVPGAAEKALGFDYDFPAYFNAVYDGRPVPLQKRAVRLRFSFDSDLSSPLKYFHNVVQLARFSSKAFYAIEEMDAL
ncbi:MAG: cobalamin-dependent protein [Oscillospiraceae bacterium]|jgi:putative methyltransferase|nr:cobalamin-dependent protein [Oscillospiraceae bacterium]